LQIVSPQNGGCVVNVVLVVVVVLVVLVVVVDVDGGTSGHVGVHILRLSLPQHVFVMQTLLGGQSLLAWHSSEAGQIRSAAQVPQVSSVVW
jgi:hypothetical protein